MSLFLRYIGETSRYFTRGKKYEFDISPFSGKEAETIDDSGCDHIWCIEKDFSLEDMKNKWEEPEQVYEVNSDIMLGVIVLIPAGTFVHKVPEKCSSNLFCVVGHCPIDVEAIHYHRDWYALPESFTPIEF